MPKKPEQDEALLKEIRAQWDYAVRFWAPIHKEGNMDVRYIAADPWDEADISLREKSEQKRPHLVFDEGTQYINSVCGKERQRKRAIEVHPESGQANKETAEKIQARLDYIWQKSRAQAKSITAFRDVCTRGYAFMGVTKRYSSTKGREQEPLIRGFDNPDSVLMDPDCKEYDGSDARFVFVMDRMPKAIFKAKYGKYDPREVDPTDDTVIVTEYWRRVTRLSDRTLMLNTPSGKQEVNESTLPDGKYDKERDGELLDERDNETIAIEKYIVQLASTEGTTTTGVEILDKESTSWKYRIPIVPVLGEKYYVATGPSAESGKNAQIGGSAKVTYLSLLRRSRDPMGLLNLCMTASAEQLAMVPKTRYIGYEGQFEGHEDEFNNIGTNPLGYLQVVPVVDPITSTVLPLPRQEMWKPALEGPEILAQACRNSIRAAVGQIASPELDKAKSGIALKRLTDSGDIASFSFPDNFAMSLEAIGCLLGEALHDTHDSARTVPIRTSQGKTELVRINERHEGPDGKPQYYDFTCADYGYTISTGPSHESQQEATQEYITTLVESVPDLVMTFGDLYTEARNLGPDAKPIIDRFRKMPQIAPLVAQEGQGADPEAQAAIAKAQQMIDLLSEHLNGAMKIINEKQIERETQIELQQLKNQSAKEVAEINQASKIAIPVVEGELEAAHSGQQQTADAMMQVHQHAHEQDMQTQQQDAAAASQDAQQAHQGEMQGQQLEAQAVQAAQQPETQ